jgi:hypothetical protein
MRTRHSVCCSTGMYPCLKAQSRVRHLTVCLRMALRCTGCALMQILRCPGPAGRKGACGQPELCGPTKRGRSGLRFLSSESLNSRASARCEAARFVRILCRMKLITCCKETAAMTYPALRKGRALIGQGMANVQLQAVFPRASFAVLITTTVAAGVLF